MFIYVALFNCGVFDFTTERGKLYLIIEWTIVKIAFLFTPGDTRGSHPDPARAVAVDYLHILWTTACSNAT